MHAALRFPNILEGIFSHLIEAQCNSAGYHEADIPSLLAAALVCQQWVEYALNVLWSGIDLTVTDLQLMELLGAAREEGSPVRSTIHSDVGLYLTCGDRYFTLKYPQ